MGAWGAGSFENDDALDWAAEVGSVEDIAAPFDELSALDEDPDAEEEPYVDVDLASRVIAAAEAVASMMGRIAPDVPDDLQKRLEKLGEPDSALIEKAKFGVSRVLMDSELLELWSEGDGDNNEWNIAITGLIDRLNADVPCETPEIAEIKGISGDLTPCAFCGKGIAENELSSLEYRDLTSKDSMHMARGIYCHLSCLNGKLHPKHIVQNWRFAVDDDEVDRILNGDID
ncbi:protein of unknown function [Parasphingorhabdus marina DSM 22363]|uniref:DUF4259 domain-containing protein n=1 Tax=Parasphingorhabdus marina DSM 22363 TaxID=1123272 RepID=A0A1N6FC25_9SPHN|nr:DUF4259 domain-containing protein [Parasphingorhabdus marina]SIN92802.1 protein of unknown function [Parasphingorhabdus marina DSM 22363]